MPDKLQVIRLDRNGPSNCGLKKINLNPNDFDSDMPEQHVHCYHVDRDLGLTVGVWTTTTMQQIFCPYPGDEFMYVLEGRASMIDTYGNETHIKEGDTFCIRNATETSWKQDGFLRKFFVTYNAAHTGIPDSAATGNGVMILDGGKLSEKLKAVDTTFPFEFETSPPDQRDAPAFVNNTRNMHVGMWESAPFESTMEPFPCNEFVQLLDGEIEISESCGKQHRFIANDVFFIPRGTICAWKVIRPSRTFYCLVA